MRGSDPSTGLVWGLKDCIPNGSPGDVGAAPGNTLRTTSLPYIAFLHSVPGLKYPYAYHLTVFKCRVQ